MNKEARRVLAFVIVGVVAAFISLGIDLALRVEEGGDSTTLPLIAAILSTVAVVGFAGTFVAEMFGINVEALGGRSKVYLKTIYYYLITWFVIYVLLYNEYVFQV